MKRIYLIFTAFILVTLLSACTTPTEVIDEPFDLCEQYPTHIDCLTDDPEDPEDPEDPVVTYEDFLDIYYLNDFHGAILGDSSNLGLAKIANLLAHATEQYPDNTIILAGGDMLQGSALSNYYSGLSTIDLMDEIGFDSFTLGNHEFDWGLETVTQYFDEDESNGEADFPLLGANVFYEGTTTMPDNIQPYTIIERGDLKIGVIGTMGYGLEYSIAQSKIDGYEFAYPVPIIEEYAIHLRQVELCDIVIWVGHDSGNINDDLMALSGFAKLDALFNAHSHSDYALDNDTIPVVQAGATGEFVGHIRLNLNSNNDVISFNAELLSQYTNAYLLQEYAPVETLISQYLDETSELFNTPIITAGEYLSSSNLSIWISELMRVSTGSDIAFQNYGGTRTSIDDNQTITLSTLFEVWPFDNVVKTVYLDGGVINALKSSGLAYSTDMTFEEGTLYKVATNDYVFDKTGSPYLDGELPYNTGIVLRDLVENELLLQSNIFDEFFLNNELQTTE